MMEWGSRQGDVAIVDVKNNDSFPILDIDMMVTEIEAVLERLDGDTLPGYLDGVEQSCLTFLETARRLSPKRFRKTTLALSAMVARLDARVTVDKLHTLRAALVTATADAEKLTTAT
jgi:hypothetical protein